MEKVLTNERFAYFASSAVLFKRRATWRIAKSSKAYFFLIKPGLMSMQRFESPPRALTSSVLLDSRVACPVLDGLATLDVPIWRVVFDVCNLCGVELREIDS